MKQRTIYNNDQNLKCVRKRERERITFHFILFRQEKVNGEKDPLMW